MFFVHTPSPMEDTPAPCPHYHAHQIASLSPENNGEANQQDPAHVGCGGCKRQQVSYPGQLTLKQAVIEDSFRSISETLATATRPDILPSPLQRGYRNKIEYSFGDYKSGDIHNPWAM